MWYHLKKSRGSIRCFCQRSPAVLLTHFTTMTHPSEVSPVKYGWIELTEGNILGASRCSRISVGYIFGFSILLLKDLDFMAYSLASSLLRSFMSSIEVCKITTKTWLLAWDNLISLSMYRFYRWNVWSRITNSSRLKFISLRFVMRNITHETNLVEKIAWEKF